MTVNTHPTEADYKHALAAHATWAQVAIKAKAWRNPFVYLWLLCIAGIMSLTIWPELISSSEWSINAPSLLATVLGFPLVAIIFGAQAAMASPGALRPKDIGILERKITEKGAPHIVASRGLFGWIVFALGSVTLFHLLSHQPGNAHRNAPTPSDATNILENKTAEHPQPLSGGTLFLNSFVAWVLAIGVIRKLQKIRHAKNLLISTPSLISPKTWEMTEDCIAERDELFQTTMQWNFIRKFLETPVVIMLYPNEQSFYLIPKAAFTSELELAEFMGLLMRKVPNGVMQPREARGFTVQPVPAIPLSEENRH